ncbi:phage holin family protein [Enterococcus casseliflavus]|uniref:phage holin family protein n=1 Tax=Enterococcus TaxID=1350 RepID=UPI00232E5186|nr:phage holin family protein [Enterococcus casseliflavus]MDB1690205.1 phage holin family protein [Enterococcus casseliflavus]
MEILQFILEEGLEIIAFLWIIGYFIKISKVVKHEWIPFLLLIISLLFTPFKLGGYTADNLVQAVLVTGAAVLGHQFVVNGERLLK